MRHFKNKLIFFGMLFLVVGWLPSLFSDVIPITLEHAVTDEERSKGLMGRKYLDSEHGMLFHFPTNQTLSFWMYNTLIDLSIAFLDDDKVIREIHELKAYPDGKDKEFFSNKIVSSQFPARYALEMNKNWFAAHSINPGDRLVWDSYSSLGYILKVKNYE